MVQALLAAASRKHVMESAGVISVLRDEFDHYFAPLAIGAGMIMQYAHTAKLAPIEGYVLPDEERT